MCICQIKQPKQTKLQWTWAMTKQLIKDEKWTFWVFQMKTKGRIFSRVNVTPVTTAAGRVCLSDSLQSWWSNELQAGLGVVSLPATNATWQLATLIFLHVGCCLPTALLPGLPGQLLCRLISINTHWLLDHHQCWTFGPSYRGFTSSALVSPFIPTSTSILQPRQARSHPRVRDKT